MNESYIMDRDYVIRKLAEYNINYEENDSKTLRLYGNYDGFHTLRFEEQSQISIDGRLADKQTLENTLYNIKMS